MGAQPDQAVGGADAERDAAGLRRAVGKLGQRRGVVGVQGGLRGRDVGHQDLVGGGHRGRLGRGAAGRVGVEPVGRVTSLDADHGVVDGRLDKRRVEDVLDRLLGRSFEPETGHKFNQLYHVYSQRFHRDDFGEDEKFDPTVLPSSYLLAPKAGDAFVYVCTIQRMAINLFGREVVLGDDDEAADEDAEELRTFRFTPLTWSSRMSATGDTRQSSLPFGGRPWSTLTRSRWA